LTYIFDRLKESYAAIVDAYRKIPLPQMMKAPCWEFEECLELLKEHFNRTDLTEDLDPEGERQLCQLANERTGIPAVFVLGFPLASRPFYTAPRRANGAANSFDLLFERIEITTGGQRLHRRDDLETALRARGMESANFESHLRMFDLGMPSAWRLRHWTREIDSTHSESSKCASGSALSARPLPADAIKRSE
jgi:nondiscriminating aspartyl-tRNA synthetase